MSTNILRDHLANMLDEAAMQLQAIIQPPPPNLENIPTGYLGLLYPYESERIAAAVINTPLHTPADVERLEEFLIAMHRMLTMTSDMLMPVGYTVGEAARWSQALQVHIRSSIAADTTTHMWSTTRFGDAIYTIDTKHRAAQLDHILEDEDFPDKLAVLANDLKEFVRTYRELVCADQGVGT